MLGGEQAPTARVMVSGSRGWTDRAAIEAAFAHWQEMTGARDVTLIHGGARGADTLAAEVATKRGWQLDEHPAHWNQLGRRAGFVRNMEMLAMEPAHVFIFWDGQSRGTKQVIDAVQSRCQGYSIEMAS